MKALYLLTTLAVLMAAGFVSAQQPTTLAEAGQLALAQKKPILIEFHRDG